MVVDLAVEDRPQVSVGVAIGCRPASDVSRMASLCTSLRLMCQPDAKRSSPAAEPSGSRAGAPPAFF